MLNKLRAFLMLVAIAFLLNAALSDGSMQAEAASGKQVEEKNLWNSIVGSFDSDGKVNETALLSTLHSPNLKKLARSLGRANLIELEEVLSAKEVNIEKLMKALRKYEMFEDTKDLLRPDEHHSMSMKERWADKLKEMSERILDKDVLSPLPSYEHFPMPKKDDKKSAEVDMKEQSINETRPYTPIIERAKESVPVEHEPSVFITKSTDKKEKDQRGADKTDQTLVWLITGAGIAFGVLLLIGAYKLISVLVKRFRHNDSAWDDSDMSLPLDVYITV